MNSRLSKVRFAHSMDCCKFKLLRLEFQSRPCGLTRHINVLTHPKELKRVVRKLLKLFTQNTKLFITPD